MPELVLVRHAKAESHTRGSDRERRLKSRGKREIQRLGVWLAQHNFRPQRVLTSPAERAASSAQKCCKAMGLTTRCIDINTHLYPGSCAALIACIQSGPDEIDRLMLVGHNPAFEQLLALLADDDSEIRTASAAILRSDQPWAHWRKGCAQLIQLQRGRDLPEGFPYPLEQPTEQRLRPAYYYRQSSVIPYRLNNAQIEVLVVGSSSGKHLVVPKGIVEPGLSALESALLEAQQEAGVVGQADTPALGSYVYRKWDAPIRVEVFAMQVSTLIDNAQWQESHRGRQWLTLAQAQAQLAPPELAALLDTLAARVKP